MKALNEIKSWLLMMQAARFWGMRKWDDGIAILLKARKLTPKSDFILTLLGMTYYQMERYAEAKEVLMEALALSPNMGRLNHLMVNVLKKSGSTVQDMIPYIKVALRNRSGGDAKSPWFAMMFPGSRERFREMGDHEKEWEEWAEKVLLEYESRK